MDNETWNVLRRIADALEGPTILPSFESPQPDEDEPVDGRNPFLMLNDLRDRVAVLEAIERGDVGNGGLGREQRIRNLESGLSGGQRLPPGLSTEAHETLVRSENRASSAIAERDAARRERDVKVTLADGDRDRWKAEANRLQQQLTEADRNTANARRERNVAERQLVVLEEAVKWALALFPDARPSNPIKDRLSAALPRRSL